MSEKKSSKQRQHAISPLRQEDFPEWFQEVVKEADMAENSPVRGCMIIKPWGYAIWERIQAELDAMIKKTGHVNAYFPLLIPLSFLEREASHVEGFAKECAVVTHHRLESSGEGKLSPAAKLEEPLIIRPTSETIIGHTYSKWVQSYRDLPILINQWANVMRWEMRTRMFLRTSEFLWQEGHTVHASKEEASEETLKMLDVYKQLAQEFLAIPVITGTKTPDERFPGACETYTVETLCQDRKALQFGTSHFLGQNFSKAFDIQFLDQDGARQYGWTTSWGTTTRMIGSVIMTHSDDDGLVLPPRLAPQQIVIIPILKKGGMQREILSFCEEIKERLEDQSYGGSPIRVAIDASDGSGGEKGWEHIKKGVPIRLEIGPRDYKSRSVFMGRRDFSPKEKQSIAGDEFVTMASKLLGEIQSTLYDRARSFLKANIQVIDSLSDFKDFFTPSSGSDGSDFFGGFASVHWHESAIGHQSLKDLKVSPRCIPLPDAGLGVGNHERGECIFTGMPSETRVLFARAY